MNPPGHSLGNNLSSPCFRYNRRYHHIYLTSCFSDDAEYRSPSVLPPQRSIVPPRPSFQNPTVIFVLKALGTCLCVALGLLASARPADAGFTATFDSVQPGSTSGGEYAGQFDWHTSSVVSGVAYNVTGTNNSSYPSTHFISFCIQFNQNISFGSTYTYNLVNLEAAPQGGTGTTTMTASSADRIRRMWAAEVDTGNLNGSATNSAAFQWAVWSILGYVPPDLTTVSGLDNAIAIQANYYKNTVSTSAGAKANLWAMASPTAQDQVIELGSGYVGNDPNGGPVLATPAPASLVLALSGLVPFLAFRRRLLNRTA